MSEAIDRWTRYTEFCYKILRRRAVDDTETTGTRSALVIAPHPDDETFGCGALILRKRSEGAKVTICVVSDGGAFPVENLSHNELVTLREKNFREACIRYGVNDSEIVLLRQPDSKLESRKEYVTHELARLISEIKPEEIYVPSRIDWHPDHIATHVASVNAANLAGLSVNIYSYLISPWLRTAWAPENIRPVFAKLAQSRIIFSACFGLHPHMVRTDGFLEKKRRIMDIYSLELEPDLDFFERWAIRNEELFLSIGRRQFWRT